MRESAASEPAAEAELLESVEHGVALLTLHRPQRANSLVPTLSRAIVGALERLAVDPQVGAIVVTGSGRNFCPGADVERLSINTPRLGLEQSVALLRQSVELVRLLHEIRKPTIAMLNGSAAGAGLGIALACDFRFMSHSARLATAFTRVGLSGDFGVTWFLTHLAGAAKARELMFDPAPIAAEEALRLGLVTRVVEAEDLVETTLARARELAAGPRIAFGYAKANLNAVLGGASLAEQLDLEAGRMMRARQTQDHAEGARAFLEKRPAIFTGS